MAAQDNLNPQQFEPWWKQQPKEPKKPKKADPNWYK